MTIPCLVLPHAVADGPANMAMDEALLDTVAANGDWAALRTYGWSAPTLSLGYFQRVAEAEADPRLKGVPVVRRPTGGGAIWHHHELTYAVVIPAAHPRARWPADLYRAIHGAIASILRASGLPAGRRGDLEPRPELRPFLCFADRDPEDLVAFGAKVVGSAQRRRAGAVLQHGSILLARSATIPDLLGVSDLAAVPADPDAWLSPIRTAIPEALSLQSVEVGTLSGLADRAGELERRTYRDPHWTGRR